MEGLSEIKDYNSLRAAFLKLDTSYDGKIDKNESEDDVNKYDKDKNDSVELWKYMEAVNQEAKKQIFKNYEIEANKKAYELLGSLEKENKLRLNSACTGIPEAQTCNNYIIPFIGFIERTIELGIERTRILDLSNKLISNSLYSEEKHLKISVSLLRICASNEEILPVLFSKEPILSENLASFLDKMYGLGFGKNEILKYINDLLVKIETVKGFSKAMRKSITVNRAFSEESLETMKELKLLGFENMQTIELMTKSEYYMELDIIKELLVDGMPKKDILRYAVSIGQITENLPKIYKTLMVNEFPEEMAFNFLIDLGKKKNLLILSDFPDVIFSLLKSYGMRKDEAINYLLSLPDDISCFAPLLEKMLSKGWDMSSACGKNVFDFVFEISKKLSEEEKIYLSQQFIATIDKVDAEKAEKNFWTVLSKTANNIESSGKQNLCEVYYLAFFSFALYQGYQNFLSYPQDILKNYIMPLQTQNTKLKLLKTLPEKFEPEVKDGKILSKIISINGITIIAQNDTDYDPIVIPGSVELGQNEISVARFNRKNFNVSFEITPDRKEKNLTASDALYEASNILPARYFYPENLKIKIAYETATNNCGHYDYNNMLTINTKCGSSLSTIVHEIAHHWDLALTFDYNGNQGTEGDISSLFYRISWVMANGEWKAKNNQDNGDFLPLFIRRDDKNQIEDIAEAIEDYVCDAKSLRKKVRDEMKKGNFELAAKYLFVKYLADFEGREYDITEKEKEITFDEVEKAKESVSDKSLTNSETFSIIEEIKQKAREKKLIP